MIRPLRPGDCIALVAPSSPFETEKYHRAAGMLQDLGYRLAPGKSIFLKRGYLAGTEAERAEDLIHAVSDPDVSAILCIRGGFGSGRLLPWLPFSIFQATPKLFLGYSDTTFLHLAFQTRSRWITFHGPNLIDMAEAPDSMNEVVSALSGGRKFSWPIEESHVLRHGIAAGTLLGGNLTCLCHLLGTPCFPDLKGALLLLEDRGEALYRLDRLFTQLKLAGALSQIAGLILGHFSECDDSQKIRDLILDLVRDFPFPVVAGLPFGHGAPNEVIPLGPSFQLNTFERSLKLTSDFGFQIA